VVHIGRIFGHNVHRLRMRLNMTQEQLCERAEIDRSYLQRIEKGTSSPTIDVAVRLRSALKSSWDELLEGLE
jgi:transcriptional regulator with XRE-family HTH domain